MTLGTDKSKAFESIRDLRTQRVCAAFEVGVDSHHSYRPLSDLEHVLSANIVGPTRLERAFSCGFELTMLR